MPSKVSPPPRWPLPSSDAGRRPPRPPGLAPDPPRSPHQAGGQLARAATFGGYRGNIANASQVHLGEIFLPGRHQEAQKARQEPRGGPLWRPEAGARNPATAARVWPPSPPLTAPRQLDRPAARSTRPGRRRPRPGRPRKPRNPRPVLTWCLFLRGSGKSHGPEARENADNMLILLSFLVEPRGVEPLTSSLRTMRSTN